MKYIVKRSEAKEISEHGISKFTEYDIGSKQLSLGVSEVNGRYPATGSDVDQEIDQLWYVLSREGAIQIAGERYAVEEGDMVHIPKGQSYVIDGNLKLVVASSPAWFAEQHQHMES